jgi:hypothetical protein
MKKAVGNLSKSFNPTKELRFLAGYLAVNLVFNVEWYER